MKTRLSLLVAVPGLLVLVIPAFAHHSFQAEYDGKKTITLHGVITKVEWTNPHAHFYVDVTDDSGKVTNWNLEMASPNALRRLGWTRDFLLVGGEVTVVAALSKDGQNRGSAKTITRADGQKMDAGSAAPE